MESIKNFCILKSAVFLEDSLKNFLLFFLLPGAIGGSPVPPEVMKKIIKEMNMRDIVVSHFLFLNCIVSFRVYCR